MQFDYLDLLRSFESHHVRYLVIGAYAVMAYTEPRFTNDLDLAIAADPDNARRAFAALAEFGAPLEGITPESLADEREFYRMRTPFTSFDVVSGLWGQDFERAWERRTRADLRGVNVNIASIEDLLLMKQAAGRPQDLIDIDKLKRAGSIRTSEAARSVKALSPGDAKEVEISPAVRRKRTIDR